MRQRVWRAVRIAWVVAGVAFTISLGLSGRASRVARRALASDSRVDVENADAVISFRPKANPKTTGLIFYPGAMVDAVAYAPLARRVAEGGYPAFIVKLPWRSAPLASQRDGLYGRTLERMRGNPAVRLWAVGGHSRGGALAAGFAKAHPGKADGLLLLGTSHPKDAVHDLSGARMPVLKITGSRDGLASEREVANNRKFLPATAVLYRIEGGNHAQFGDYAWQLGDDDAGISRARQQELTLKATLEFLKALR